MDCSPQAPLSMGFSRREYWSGLLCPPPGDLPDPEIEPVSLMSPILTGGFFTTSSIWEAPAVMLPPYDTFFPMCHVNEAHSCSCYPTYPGYIDNQCLFRATMDRSIAKSFPLVLRHPVVTVAPWQTRKLTLVREGRGLAM